MHKKVAPAPGHAIGWTAAGVESADRFGPPHLAYIENRYAASGPDVSQMAVRQDAGRAALKRIHGDQPRIGRVGDIKYGDTDLGRGNIGKVFGDGGLDRSAACFVTPDAAR